MICTCMYCHLISNNNWTTDSSFAGESAISNINKTNYGFQLESNVTNGNVSSEIAYRNPQHGIFMLFPQTGLSPQVVYRIILKLVHFMLHCKIFPIQSPARLTITVMSHQQDISLKDFTNMTLSSLNQTDQIMISSSDPTTLAGRPGHQVVFSTLPNIGNPVSFEIMHSWITVGSKVYVFQYSAESSKFDANLPTVKQILESLRIE